jgi:hypothetical protein
LSCLAGEEFRAIYQALDRIQDENSQTSRAWMLSQPLFRVLVELSFFFFSSSSSSSSSSSQSQQAILFLVQAINIQQKTLVRHFITLKVKHEVTIFLTQFVKEKFSANLDDD